MDLIIYSWNLSPPVKLPFDSVNCSKCYTNRIEWNRIMSGRLRVSRKIYLLYNLSLNTFLSVPFYTNLLHVITVDERSHTGPFHHADFITE